MLADEIKLPKDDEPEKPIDIISVNVNGAPVPALDSLVDIPATFREFHSGSLEKLHEELGQAFGIPNRLLWPTHDDPTPRIEHYYGRCRPGFDEPTDDDAGEPEKKRLEVGDVVELVSARTMDSPIMTIAGQNVHAVNGSLLLEVVWFDDSKHLQHAVFPADLLRRYEED